MDTLKCFKCHWNVPGGLDGLIHFQHVHALSVTGRCGRQGFVCAQNGCLRTFAYCKNFRQHIRTKHLVNELHNEGACVGLLEEQDVQIGNNVNFFADNQLDLDGERNHDLAALEIRDENQGEEGLIHPQRNLRVSVVRNICELQSRGSVTSSVISDVAESAVQVFNVTSSYVKKRVELFLRTKGLDNDPQAEELMRDLDFSNPYHNLMSLDEQINVLKEEFHYIEPREIYLGKRQENRFNSKSGQWRIVDVAETFQYVPFLEVIKLIYSNKEARDHILHEKFPEDQSKRHSYTNGTHFKGHPIFSTSISAIRLIIYYDEIEIVNPLGSKTGIHKLGCFYFILQNLPDHVNSKLSSIHVLLICYDQDVKKYGFKKLLQPFLDDLKILENGFPLKIEEENYIVRGSIVAVVGDTLAIHALFGFLGPGAKMFCRCCLISPDDLHAGNFEVGQPRTKEIHDTHLMQIAERPNDKESQTRSGVSHDSVLHSSEHFHVTRNKLFDIMHDILLGVGPWEVKLTLRHYICELKLFTVNFFNSRVKFFKYGALECKNKPQDNLTRTTLVNESDHTLKQTAAQMWVLLRALPFLLKDKVPENDRHMELILYLLRIMEICFAPKLETSILPYLSMLITEHHQLFLELFTEHNLINKHYHMVHYPDCILEFGPLLAMWCMRFEAKHQCLKKRAHVVCNFKNPPKTLFRVPQAVQAAEWGDGAFQLNSFKCDSGETVDVRQILSALHLRNQFRLNDKDIVFKANVVTVNGAVYKQDFYVCVKSAQEDNHWLPMFGKIVEILCIVNQVFLFVRLEKTELLDTSLNAFLISEGNASRLVEVSQLADYKAVNSWLVPTGSGTYISMRHIVT